MVLTKHALLRLKKRLGLNKNILEKNAILAFEKGITLSTSKGLLKKYIKSEYNKYCTANNIRIYCRYVYIFADDKLITVFPLKSELHKLEDICKS